MRIEPGRALALVNRRQRPPQRVFRNNPAHPQQRRVDAIPAHGRHVRIAPVSSQDRQQPRPQHIGLARRVRARVMQRTAVAPTRPQAGQVQKFDEVRQLPQRRDRARAIPPHLHLAGRRLNARARQQPVLRLFALALCLTHRVTPPLRRKPRLCLHCPTIGKAQLPF